MKTVLYVLCAVFLIAVHGCYSDTPKVTMENNAVLLDVRTSEEYKAGYLAGAILVPLAGLDEEITVKVPDKSTPVYIYCRSGRRSGIAVEKLKAKGYTAVYNLGGLNDAGEKLGIPITK